jgi:hypothetical protein
MGCLKYCGYTKGMLRKEVKEKLNIISTEEALEDIEPIEWSNEVIQGKKKVIVDMKCGD